MKFLILLVSLLIPLSAHAQLMNVWMQVPEDLNTADETWQAENTCAMYELYRLGAEWSHAFPEYTAGTVVNGGDKIILSTINIDGDDPLTLVEGMLTVCELPWTVLNMQTLYPNDAYCDESSIGNQEDCELGGFVWHPEAPTVYRKMRSTALDFQETRYIKDEDDNVIGTRPKSCEYWPVWNGTARTVCE